MAGFFQKSRNPGHDFERNTFVIGMTGFAAHFMVAPPGRPITEQKPLLITGTNQVLKRHLVVLGWTWGNELKKTLQGLVGKLIGEITPSRNSVRAGSV